MFWPVLNIVVTRPTVRLNFDKILHIKQTSESHIDALCDSLERESMSVLNPQKDSPYELCNGENKDCSRHGFIQKLPAWSLGGISHNKSCQFKQKSQWQFIKQVDVILSSLQLYQLPGASGPSRGFGLKFRIFFFLLPDVGSTLCQADILGSRCRGN